MLAAQRAVVCTHLLEELAGEESSLFLAASVSSMLRILVSADRGISKMAVMWAFSSWCTICCPCATGRSQDRS